MNRSSERESDPQPWQESAQQRLPAQLSPERRRSYWRRNLAYLALLLAVWATVSFGCGILFVEELNRFHLPGTRLKLGFWFAQQGSIYVFVLLIFVYVGLMNRLDREYAVDEG